MQIRHLSDDQLETQPGQQPFWLSPSDRFWDNATIRLLPLLFTSVPWHLTYYIAYCNYYNYYNFVDCLWKLICIQPPNSNVKLNIQCLCGFIQCLTRRNTGLFWTIWIRRNWWVSERLLMKTWTQHWNSSFVFKGAGFEPLHLPDELVTPQLQGRKSSQEETNL